MEKGSVRLGKLEYYRRWENRLLGDPNDGKGLFHLDRNPLQTDSGNEVYAWCLSLRNITQDHILRLVGASGYNCILVVDAPEEFFRRVKDWLSKHLNAYWLHCGMVTYNRGESVDNATANAQKFHFNVFQKALRFHQDMEYRMSVTDLTFGRRTEDHLDIEIGNCHDIMSIRALPKPVAE